MTTATASPALRAAIYTRVSTQVQEDGYSLDTQETGCRQHTDGHGYQVADIYREVFSGTELWERPQLTALREAIRRHEVDVVVAYAIDRLSRDPVHLGVLLSEAEHAGVSVEFVTEPLDDSPEGQLIRFIRGYVAKVEHAKITERTQRGRQARVAAGKPIAGCRPPYGYCWQDDEKSALLPDPLTAAIVRRIFAESADGGSLKTIADGLTRDGIPTVTGRPFWREQTISSLLHRRVYVGEYLAYRYEHIKSGRGKRSNRLRAGGQMPLAGVAPPLVSASDWQTVQTRLVQNVATAARRNAHPQMFLLRGGYAACAACGRPLHTDGSRAAGPRYRCVGKYKGGGCTEAVSVSAPKLDNAAWAKVKALATDPSVIEDALARLEEDDPTTDDLAALDRRAAEVERQRRNIARRIATIDDDDVAAPLTEKLAELARQRAGCEQERERILSRRGAWQQAQARLDDLGAWCRAVGARLDAPSLDYETRRAGLDEFGIRAVVEPGGHFEIRTGIDLGAAIGSLTTS